MKEIQDLAAGDEVAIRAAFGQGIDFGYVVDKITPSGQVNVKYVKTGSIVRFNKHGREIGSGSDWHYRFLLADVQSCREQVDHRKLRVEAAAALAAVRKPNMNLPRAEWGTEGLRRELADLQELLEKAVLLVTALPEDK